MEKFKLRENDDFIKLGQLLKAAGLVDSGAAAKEAIISGEVKVNGEADTRRGKKLVAGDTVEFENTRIEICR